jgi:hypothetical protein
MVHQPPRLRASAGFFLMDVDRFRDGLQRHRPPRAIGLGGDPPAATPRPGDMVHQPLRLRASAGFFSSWTWVRPLLFRSTLPVCRPGSRAQSNGAISGRDGVEASSRQCESLQLLRQTAVSLLRMGREIDHCMGWKIRQRIGGTGESDARSLGTRYSPDAVGLVVQHLGVMPE